MKDETLKALAEKATPLPCLGLSDIDDSPKWRTRLLLQVPKDGTGCLQWLGYIGPDGYGKYCTKLKDGRVRTLPAHRLVYEVLVAPIPAGFYPDHLCRNRACVNPSHIEIVTLRENTLRGVGPTAQNARMTECKNGHSFSPENTYIDKLGRRNCKPCHRVDARGRMRALRQRRKEQAN